MRSFCTFLDEGASTRVGIEHLTKMKPLDFISLMEMFKNEFKGILSRENASITEKFDGAGMRIGIDSSDDFFFESSRSGPIKVVGEFSDYNMKKWGKPSPISKAYDDVLSVLKKSSKLTGLLRDWKAKLGASDIKVFGEMFYNPIGEITKDKIKFVAVSYDVKKLGKLATFVLFKVEADGKNIPQSDKIISELKKLSTSLIKYEDASINIDTVDIKYEIDDFFKALNNFKDIEGILSSRKKIHADAKSAISSMIADFQERISGMVLQGIKKGKFGRDIEGIVVALSNGKSFKVVTSSFTGVAKVDPRKMK